MKLSRDNDDTGEDERSTKAKRHEVEIPSADVDIRLAEKLDSILKISGPTSKPKFLTNRPKSDHTSGTTSELLKDKATSETSDKLKARHLSKEELKERLIKRYDTLVPELDPKRPSVRVVKILSANESMELGKNQAQKQMERQLELNSVSGNQLAQKGGAKAFRFNDGYEIPDKSFTHSQVDE